MSDFTEGYAQGALDAIGAINKIGGAMYTVDEVMRVMLVSALKDATEEIK